MAPYREAAPGPTPPAKVRCTENICTFPPCACGCAHDTHYWFNSEFVECRGRGFTTCTVDDCQYEHAVCKCERYEPNTPIVVDRGSYQ